MDLRGCPRAVICATQNWKLCRRRASSRSEITDAAMGERAECVMLNKGPSPSPRSASLADILKRMQAHQKKSAPCCASSVWRLHSQPLHDALGFRMLVYPLRRRWHAVVQLHIYPGGTWYHNVKHEDVPDDRGNPSSVYSVPSVPLPTASQPTSPWFERPNARVIIAAFSTGSWIVRFDDGNHIPLLSAPCSTPAEIAAQGIAELVGVDAVGVFFAAAMARSINGCATFSRGVRFQILSVDPAISWFSCCTPRWRQRLHPTIEIVAGGGNFALGVINLATAVFRAVADGPLVHIQSNPT